MTQQQSTPFAVPWKALLAVPLIALVVAVACAGGVGGVTLGVAPDFSIGLVAPLVCPAGTRAQYTALHQSYQRPGESTPLVECVSPTGARREVTGQAILTFFVVAVAAAFIPTFLVSLWMGRQQPAPRPARQLYVPTPPAARPPAPDDTTQRLEKLDALRARGMITAQEYEQKRKEILSSL